MTDQALGTHTCGTAPDERHCAACWWENYLLCVIARDAARIAKVIGDQSPSDD